MKKIKGLGEIAVLGASLLWGCMSLSSRPLLDDYGFSSMQVTLFRGIITAIVLGVYFLIKDKSMFALTKKDILPVAFTAVFGFSLFVLYLISISVNPVSVGILLEYTSIIFVTIASRFMFKESITLQKIVSIIGAVVGMVMIVGADGLGEVSFLGVIVGICCGVSYAGYSMANAVSGKRLRSGTIVFYVFLLVGLLCIPFSNVWEIPEKISAHPESILHLLVVSIAYTAIPYLLFSASVRLISTSKVGILSIFELVVGTVVGWIRYGEELNTVGIIGMIIVISALVLLEIRFKPKDHYKIKET